MTNLFNLIQDVEERQAGPEFNNKGKVIIRKYDNRIISHVSDKYTLVKNKDVFMPFIDRFGVKNIQQGFSWANGKYSMIKINTGRTFDFGTTDKPDILTEQIIIQNSYNLTRSFKIMIGAFRRVCLNGMYSGNLGLSFRAVHIGKIDHEAVVNNAMNNYLNNDFSSWRKMAETALTQDQQIEAVKDLKVFEETPDDNIYNPDGNANLNSRINWLTTSYLSKPESIDNARNAWGLYNQVNRSIARVLSGRSMINKVILGNNNAEKFILNKFNLN